MNLMFAVLAADSGTDWNTVIAALAVGGVAVGVTVWWYRILQWYGEQD